MIYVLLIRLHVSCREKNNKLIMKNKGENIVYQPQSTLRLEVRMQDETVWLTQAQIAELFGTKRPAITKHLNNIYSSGELVENIIYLI